MIRLPLVDRIKFQLERQFVKGAGYQLLFVACAIGLISLAGGAAIWATGAGGALSDWTWWAFLRLSDPGYLGDDQGVWRRIVSTALTVGGYVLFLGALVAIMTQWLIARMREFERGLTPVALTDHVVIIGFTNRTIPLLRELLGTDHAERRFLAAFGTRRLRPVILSEDISPHRVQELRSDPMIRHAAGRIILRYGSPLDDDAIQRAACLNAAAVIMPSDFGDSTELVSPDVETIRALLSIDARAEEHGEPPPLVIAEIQDMRRIDMVRRAYRGPLEVIPSDSTVSRLLAQNLLHPGLSGFFREALAAGEGNDFFLLAAGELAGEPIGKLAGRFPHALVFGVLRPSGEDFAPHLNPAPSFLVEPDDRLVLFARTHADSRAMPRVPGRTVPPPGDSAPAAKGERPNRPPRTAHHVLMLGWSQRVPNLLHELASYGDHDFRADLVSTAESEWRTREIERYSEQARRIPVRHIEADYLLAGELGRLDLDQYTAIYLLTSDRLDNIEEADARAIVGHRVVEELLGDRTPRPQILLELGDPDNEALVRSPGVETLVSPLIISHVMAQVALRRETRLIFDELFTPGGAELEFRAPEYYDIGIDPSGRTFRDLSAGVRTRGDTLLGVRRADRTPALVLNPARDRLFQLREGDRLCVLTTIEP